MAISTDLVTCNHLSSFVPKYWLNWQIEPLRNKVSDLKSVRASRLKNLEVSLGLECILSLPEMATTI